MRGRCHQKTNKPVHNKTLMPTPIQAVAPMLLYSYLFVTLHHTTFPVGAQGRSDLIRDPDFTPEGDSTHAGLALRSFAPTVVVGQDDVGV